MAVTTVFLTGCETSHPWQCPEHESGTGLQCGPRNQDQAQPGRPRRTPRAAQCRVQWRSRVETRIWNWQTVSLAASSCCAPWLEPNTCRRECASKPQSAATHPFCRSWSRMWAAMKPDAPVRRTRGDMISVARDEEVQSTLGPFIPCTLHREGIAIIPLVESAIRLSQPDKGLRDVTNQHRSGMTPPRRIVRRSGVHDWIGL